MQKGGHGHRYLHEIEAFPEIPVDGLSLGLDVMRLGMKREEKRKRRGKYVVAGNALMKSTNVTKVFDTSLQELFLIVQT